MINVMSTGTGWSAAELAAIGMTAEELKAEQEKAAERLKAKREQAKTEANELQANRELFQSKLTLWLPDSEGARDCPTCSTWQTPQNTVVVERANTVDGLLELYEMNALAQKLGSWALETLGWKQKVLLPLLDDFCQRHRYGGSPVLPAYSARKLERQLADRPKLLLCIQLMKDWKIDRLPAWLVEEMSYSIYGQDDIYTAALTTGLHNRAAKNDKEKLLEAAIKVLQNKYVAQPGVSYDERKATLAKKRALAVRTIDDRIHDAKARLQPPARLSVVDANQDSFDGNSVSRLESIPCNWDDLFELSDLFLLGQTQEQTKVLLHVEAKSPN